MKNNFTAKGFTLIELIIVVAIIGVLSAIVLVSLGTANTKGRDSRRVSDLKEIQTALGLYYSEYQNYPASLDLLPGAGFISRVPTPPNGAGDVAYKYSALGSGVSCSDYHLGVTLEDVANKILQVDSDATASSVCDGSAEDFDGTIGNIYDIRP